MKLYMTAWKDNMEFAVIRVDADGNLNRYHQECMIVHIEWITL